MKRIGYIFKYNTDEDTGILVFGNWCSQKKLELPFEHIVLKDKPIIFKTSDCIGHIKTGDLVYFTLIEEKAFNIKRASLSNFDKTLVVSYLQNCTITFEQIYDSKTGNINEGILIVLGKYLTNQDLLTNTKNNKCGIEYFDLVKNKFIRKIDLDLDLGFPQNIKDLYECFGKYGHEQRYDTIRFNRKIKRIRKDQTTSVIINIFDLSLWIDEETIKSNYFGNTTEEIVDLYNIFVTQKDSINITTTRYPIQNVNTSDPWRILLNKMEESDLIVILKKCPLLQPFFPLPFCTKYVHLLNEKYDFPSIEIAELFLINCINNIASSTTYCHTITLLNSINNSEIPCHSGTHINLYSIDRAIIKDLVNSIEKKLNEVMNYIKIQINDNNFNGIGNLSDYIDEQNIDLMLQIGIFYDDIADFMSIQKLNFLKIKRIIEKYNKIPEETYPLIDPYLSSILKSKFRNLLELDQITPFWLHSIMEDCSKWIDSSFLTDNHYLIASTFSKTSDLSDLWDALNYNYISTDDFLFKLKDLIKEFSIQDLARFITNTHHKTNHICFAETPIEVQNYILNRIVDLYEPKGLNYGECVQISDFNGFCYLEGFIRWLTELKSNQYGSINQDAIESAISKAIKPLNQQEVRYLYEKRYLVKSKDSVKTILNQYCEQLMKEMEYQNYKDNLSDESCNGYSSSWAQDVEEYSDDEIDTIFDGDPDAYWNID